VRNGADAGAVNLKIQATGMDIASANSQAVAGGLVGGTDNNATVSVTPTVSAYIGLSSGVVSTSSNIEVTATGNPEGDATTKGVTGGLIGVGASDAHTTINPNVTAYIDAPTVQAGSGATDSIKVLATVAPSGTAPDYSIQSVDQQYAVRCNHGPQTGVSSSMTPGATTGGLQTTFVDPTTDPPAFSSGP
jgi:hypothetical protein